MPPLSVLPESENLQTLRRNVREMNDLFTGGAVNFVALAKCFQGTTAALLATLEENHSSSVRFAAVAKALDLKTPKSKLEAFIRDDYSDPVETTMSSKSTTCASEGAQLESPPPKKVEK